MCYRFNNDYCFSAFMCRANLYLFFINFILYRLLSWHNKFSMLLCEKTIKSRKFSRTSLCRLWLIFWNRYFETTFWAISIFWISFNGFLIRALLKNVFLLNFIFGVVILFRSSLIFFFCFLFIEFSFSFQWQFLNDFIIFLELSELNGCLCFF